MTVLAMAEMIYYTVYQYCYMVARVGACLHLISIVDVAWNNCF